MGSDLAKRGIGLVMMHYAIEVPKGDAGDHFVTWVGGYFETHYSVNPHWIAEFTDYPNHPIAHGLKPFEMDDEWYYHMRFNDDMKGVTPILSSIAPESTLTRPDGPHSGNPHVRSSVAKGEAQHLGWCIERPDGGRGVGFTGLQAENVVRKSTGSTGTISYCAPEVLRQDQFGRYGNFTTKSDIFSLGMILYFMCFGRLPYKSADSIQEEFEDMDMLRAEISGWSGFVDERRERPELPNQLYEFLKRLLALDPNERPSANDILTAIRTEKGLEAPSRTRNGSNAGLGGRIIQSFDSPMPPGTPVNGISLPFDFKLPISWNTEPSKRVRSGAYIEDASETSPTPSPSSQLVLEAKSHSHSRTPSPQRNDFHRNESPSMNPRTPLLMPPPSTPMSRLKHQFSIYKHYAEEWAHQNRHTLHLFLRLAIFFAKVVSVIKPCAPLVTRDVVMWPLILLASFELAAGLDAGWVRVGLFVAHFVVLVVTMRFGGGLCVRDMNWGWTE